MPPSNKPLKLKVVYIIHTWTIKVNTFFKEISTFKVFPFICRIHSYSRLQNETVINKTKEKV